MQLRFEYAGQVLAIDAAREGDTCRIQSGSRTLLAEVVRAAPGEATFRLAGRLFTALYAEDDRGCLWVAADGRTFVLERPTPPARRGTESRAAGRAPQRETVLAEMPGQVRAVLAAEGQTVTDGQTLLVMEAMKMELRVSAPHAGRVTRLPVREGQVVERGQVLAEVSRLPEEAPPERAPAGARQP